MGYKIWRFYWFKKICFFFT